MEGYNPQYLKWKKGEKTGYDWIDCLNFILIGNAEVSDGLLSPEEMAKIQEINEITFAHWVGDGMPYASDEPNKKLKIAHDWYFSIIDNNSDDQINIKVQEEMTKVVKFLKSQDWFNPTFANSIINWLVEIAQSDGNIIANEKGSINSLAEFFEVKKPFL
jgi:tellurite resistance protein